MPNITSDSKFFATDGNPIQLTCHVTMDHSAPYAAAFFHKEVMLKSNDYLTVTELAHENENTQRSHFNLTIHNSLHERDEGDYRCTVMDYHNNTNSKIETIKFVTDPVIDFTVSSSIITINKSRKQAAFLIEYKAFPSATFNFYNPKGEQISCDMDVMNRNKYDVVIDPDKIKFVVKYPTLEDYGNYDLIATTVGQSFNTTLRLIVNGEKFETCQN